MYERHEALPPPVVCNLVISVRIVNVFSGLVRKAPHLLPLPATNIGMEGTFRAPPLSPVAEETIARFGSAIDFAKAVPLVQCGCWFSAVIVKPAAMPYGDTAFDWIAFPGIATRRRLRAGGLRKLIGVHKPYTMVVED